MLFLVNDIETTMINATINPGSKNSLRSHFLTAFPIVLWLILSICFPDTEASEIFSSLSSNTVSPGDAFISEITTPHRPTGEFKGDRIIFYPFTEKTFIAFIPVSLHTKPGSYTLLINYGNKKNHHTISVSPQNFPEINLSLPGGKVFLSPENEARAERESRVLSMIWEKSTKLQWKEDDFLPPMNTPISSGFGLVRIMNGKKRSIHKGIDYKGRTGFPVKSINAGRVLFRGDLFFGGNTLIIDHGAALYSYYMHLSKFRVKAGESVKRGETIGYVGATGRATGPHLHMGVKLKGFSINPESLFKINFQEVSKN